MLKFIGEFKELEKYGFEKRLSPETGEIERYAKYDKLYNLTYMHGTVLPYVTVATRKIYLGDDELLFDFIKAGLIDKEEA